MRVHHKPVLLKQRQKKKERKKERKEKKKTPRNTYIHLNPRFYVKHEIHVFHHIFKQHRTFFRIYIGCLLF